MKNNIKELCKKIKLIIFDVDGVLTNGKIIISSNGSESKMFCVEDGTGAAIANFANIPLIFLSGRYSKSTEIRAKELKVYKCIQGCLDKKNALDQISEELNICFAEIAYVGDGLIDVPVLKEVGLSIGVPNAHKDVKRNVKYITNLSGGDGVLTEVVELILKHQGEYLNTIDKMKKIVYKL